MEVFRVVCFCMFEFLGIHICQKLIVFCSDFRFDSGNRKLRRAERIRWADEIKVPGGIKHLVDKKSDMLEWVELLHEEHKTEVVFLVAHANCGWYAHQGVRFHDDEMEQEQEFYIEQLQLAREVVKEILPQVRIELRYARLVKSQGWIKRFKIEYIEVV